MSRGGVVDPAAAGLAQGEEVLARTLPGRLALWARLRGDAPALREKRLGIWREITWKEYYEQVQAIGLVLRSMGVERGDHVAILSDNRPEWLYADLAAQGIGARGVGIYQTSPAAELEYIVNHCRAKVLFCEDQEQVDKAVDIAARTPHLRHLVVFDPRGLRGYEDARLRTWDDVLAEGGRLRDADPQAFERALLALDPDEPAMVVYTSGTTGNPKGALLTSRSAVEPAVQTAALLGYGEQDTVLSYLPLCHVAEKAIAVFLPLATAAIVHFGEAIETVQDDLRQVSPTVFLGVPRIWEKMHARVTIKMRDASWLKRTIFDFFTRKGQELEARRRAGQGGLLDRLLWAIGELLLYRPLKERLGLGRCRLALSGAAPISSHLLAWYHGIGVRIAEAYGLTECAGVSHTNLPDALRLGTVGRPLPHVECRLAEDGEVLVRGVNVFAGYLGDEAATRATRDAEGWLHTGDLGEIDDEGFLRITGRKKEILITSGGKNLSPEKIENALKTSPYIKEAVAVGEQRNYVSALIQIEYDTVGAWATGQGIAYTSFADLASRPEVVALVGAEIEQANALLARVESVRGFRLFSRELDQDEGELTATQKVRRREVVRLHAALVADIYGDVGRDIGREGGR